MGFVNILMATIAVVFSTIILLCFCVIPLSRYLALRVFLFFRYLFCKSKLSSTRFMSFIFPHFISHKPDFFLLSGKKLYAIKLKSFRKSKSRVVFTDNEKWQIESLRGAPPLDSGNWLSSMAMIGYNIGVHKRFQKAPMELLKYTAKINRALANEEIDCIPVILISPSISELRTNNKIDLMDGDTIFHGIVISRGFYPTNLKKSAIDAKEAKRIIKIAKSQLKKIK